jgi:hypothetical protein
MCFFIFYPSCKEKAVATKGLSGYYIPADQLPRGGLVYTYRNLADTALDNEVWKHVKTPEGQIMSINYDNRQQVVQKQYEHIHPTGILIDSLFLVYHDGSGDSALIPVTVHSNSKFPFQPTDSSQVWLTKLEWHQPDDSLHVVLERRRRFLGDTSWTFEGKEIPAIKFSTEDKFETEEIGWTTSEWKGLEVYALNYGLVYYRRNISKDLRLEFELYKREAASE